MHVTAVASMSSGATPSLSVQPVPRVEAEASAPRQPIQDAVDRMNAVSRWFRSTLTFKIDEESRRIVVQIIDKQTGELIRQIPPETVLKQAEALKELSGLLYDQKA
jgi:flagellar protein FlaG